MEGNESHLLRLTIAAHEAAVEPSQWPAFLAGYAKMVGADVALIQRHYFSHHRSHILASFGLTPRLTAEYNDHYSRMNVWREHGRHLYVPGRIVFDPEMYPRHLLKRSEYYNDYMLPSVGSTHSMAGVVDIRGDEALCLTVLRDDRRDGWQGRESPIVSALLPHVARARRTEERFQMLEAGETALQALNIGVVFVDDEGTVLFCNAVAERILSARHGLTRRNGRLIADDAGANAALQRLIGYAVTPGVTMDAPPDVLVPRALPRLSYHVSAAPLRKTPAPFIGTTRPAAYVLITDPELARPLAYESLQQGFGLTRREAALAMALAEGNTVAQAAERLDMRYETARTHLRRIFGKTHTSRQAELVMLLERLAGGRTRSTPKP